MLFFYLCLIGVAGENGHKLRWNLIFDTLIKRNNIVWIVREKNSLMRTRTIHKDRIGYDMFVFYVCNINRLLVIKYLYYVIDIADH